MDYNYEIPLSAYEPARCSRYLRGNKPRASVKNKKKRATEWEREKLQKRASLSWSLSLGLRSRDVT